MASVKKVDDVRIFLSQQINATRQSDEAFFEGWSDDKIFAFLCIKYYLANDDAAPADIAGWLMEKDGKIFAIGNYAKNGSEEAPTLAFFDYTVDTSIGGDFCAFPKEISTLIASEGICSQGIEKEIKTRWEKACEESLDEEEEKKLLYYFTGITPRQNQTKVNANVELGNKIIGEFVCEDIQFGWEIKSWIASAHSGDGRIAQGAIKIDRARNVLSYRDSGEECGIVVNLSAKSLRDLFAEHGKNLLGLNLRFHVSGKKVDDGIKKTMAAHSNWFWGLNNGIVIVCDDYKIEESVDADGRGTVNLTRFSVVNGGQTTYMISKMEEEVADFFFVCKIIKMGCERALNGLKPDDIAVASNSQKPIKAKDLRANGVEQNKLKAWLQQRGLQYIVKQGEKHDSQYKKISLDLLGKTVLASILQMPWTKSDSKCLFQDPYYDLIFGTAERLPQAVNCYPDIIEAEQIYKSFSGSNDALTAGKDVVANCRTAALAATVLISWYFQHGKTFPNLPGDTFDEETYPRFYENFLSMNRIFNRKIQGKDRKNKLFRLFSWLAAFSFRPSVGESEKSAANLTKSEEFYLGVLPRLVWNMENTNFSDEFEELFV